MIDGGLANGAVVQTTTTEPSRLAATEPVSTGVVPSAPPTEHGVVHGCHDPASERAASISWRSLYISHAAVGDEATRTSSAGPAPGCMISPEGSNVSAFTGEVKIWNAGVGPLSTKANTSTNPPEDVTAAGASPEAPTRTDVHVAPPSCVDNNAFAPSVHPFS